MEERWRETSDQIQNSFVIKDVLATVFWNSRDVLLINFVHNQRTVNAEYYCILLHEVQVENLSATFCFFTEIHWTPLEQPAHSPDLSPCDYYMFRPLKEARESMMTPRLNRTCSIDEAANSIAKKYICRRKPCRKISLTNKIVKRTGSCLIESRFSLLSNPAAVVQTPSRI